jgi:hypothetical protein
MINGKIDDWELKIKRFERKIKRVTKIDRLFILEHDKIDKYIDKKKR